jgi:hypothetical protein
MRLADVRKAGRRLSAAGEATDSADREKLDTAVGEAIDNMVMQIRSELQGTKDDEPLHLTTRWRLPTD